MHCCCANARRFYVMRVLPFCHVTTLLLLSSAQHGNHRDHTDRSHMNTDGNHSIEKKTVLSLSSSLGQAADRLYPYPAAGTRSSCSCSCCGTKKKSAQSQERQIKEEEFGEGD